MLQTALAINNYNILNWFHFFTKLFFVGTKESRIKNTALSLFDKTNCLEQDAHFKTKTVLKNCQLIATCTNFLVAIVVITILTWGNVVQEIM